MVYSSYLTPASLQPFRDSALQVKFLNVLCSFLPHLRYLILIFIAALTLIIIILLFYRIFAWENMNMQMVVVLLLQLWMMPGWMSSHHRDPLYLNFCFSSIKLERNFHIFWQLQGLVFGLVMGCNLSSLFLTLLIIILVIGHWA